VYGTLGEGSTSTSSGARELGLMWTDSAGDLWIFGGFIRDSVGNAGE
jgi:hypothetical protein